MKKCFVFVLLAVFTIGCSSNEKKMEEENISFEVISKGNLGGAGREGIVQQNLIISDEDTWLNLLSKMDLVNITSDRFSETNIDFSEYTVIAVFDNIRSSGGFSIEIEVTTDVENIFVEVLKFVPGYLDNVATVITQPYYILKIPKNNKKVVFSSSVLDLP